MVQITDEILQNLTLIRKTIALMPLKADSMDKRNTCLSSLKEVSSLASKLNDVEFDKKELSFLKNSISGIFDGLKDKPIKKNYLNEVVQDVDAHLNVLIKEWSEIHLQYKSDEKAPKDKKTKTTKLDWKEGLQTLQNQLEEKEKTSAATEKPDAETINEETWFEDAEKLKEFQKSKAKVLKVSKVACLTSPIIITSGLNKLFIEKLEEHNFEVSRIFNLYSLISNATLVGIDSEFEDTFKNDVDFIKYIESTATKHFKQSMRLSSYAYTYKNHSYYIVLPKSIPSSFSINEWTLQR